MDANSLGSRITGPYRQFVERLGLGGRDREADIERDAEVGVGGAGIPANPLEDLTPADQIAVVVSPVVTTFKTSTSTLLHTHTANERFAIKLAFMPKISTTIHTTNQHIVILQREYNERTRAARIAANMRYLEVLQYGAGGREAVLGAQAVEQRREWEAGCVEWALFPAKQFWILVLWFARFFCGFCGN